MDKSLTFESDNALLEGLRNSTPAAFEALYRRYYRMVAKQAADQGITDAEAEDVFQEVLIILVRKVREADFTLTAKLSTFLFAIARNLILKKNGDKKEIATEETALFKLAGDDARPVLLRTALGHAEFESLHPFEDGNGRVGRMLITLMLWQGRAISAPHFYISRYFEDRKDEYLYRLREVSANDDWDGWCEFFLAAVAQQAVRNLDVAQSISDFYDEMKPRFIELLSSKFAVAALDYLFTYPVFSNSRFTSKAGIPSQTAARFTRVLLQEGLLQTVSDASGRRSAVYRFEPLMSRVRV